MQQTAKLTTITPDIARSILKQNTHNRQLRQHVVMRYADQMTAGEWKITGDTIKIASDGTVLDGQHRLLACIESSVTFQAYLVCGLDREVYDLIDAGLPRRTSDALHIQGENNTALLGSVLGWISRFELGTLAHRYSPKLTSHEALELLRKGTKPDVILFDQARKRFDYRRLLLPVSHPGPGPRGTVFRQTGNRRRTQNRRARILPPRAIA